MEMPKLLTCDGCGRWPELTIDGYRQFGCETVWRYRLDCRSCLRSESGPTEEKAVLRWNREYGKSDAPPTQPQTKPDDYPEIKAAFGRGTKNTSEG